MAKQIKMSVTLPVESTEIYRAWFDSKKHSEFTDSKVQINKKVDSIFFFQDGAVEGKILQMIRNKQITMSWSSCEFPVQTQNSKVEVTFEPVAENTKMIVIHSDLSEEEDVKELRKLWKSKYFNPMKKYFSSN